MQSTQPPSPSLQLLLQKISSFESIINSLTTTLTTATHSDQIQEHDPTPDLQTRHNNLTTTTLLLSELRGLNRKIHLETQSLRTEISDRKDFLDKGLLELQNLEYEEVHLRKEIEQCEELVTVYQTVPLESEETFLSKAPKDLTTSTTPHERMLNRFKFELMERKRIQQDKTNLVAQQNDMAKIISSKKSEIVKLADRLEAAMKGTLDLQRELQIPLLDARAKHEQVKTLPKPLFILYQLLSGYAQVNEDITVSLSGDFQQALHLIQQQPDLLQSPQPLSPTSSNLKRLKDDIEASPIGSPLKKLKSDSEPTSEPLTRTTSLSHPTSATPDPIKPSKEDTKTFWKEWPIKIIVAVLDNPGTKTHTCQLTFRYIPRAGIITLSSQIPQSSTTLSTGSTSTIYLSKHPLTNTKNFFAGLFDSNDDGESVPNPSVAALFGDTEGYDPSNIGYAYHFLQPLCGLYYPTQYQIKISVNKILAGVRDRVAVLKNLDTVVSGLMRLSFVKALPVPEISDGFGRLIQSATDGLIVSNSGAKIRLSKPSIDASNSSINGFIEIIGSGIKPQEPVAFCVRVPMMMGSEIVPVVSFPGNGNLEPLVKFLGDEERLVKVLNVAKERGEVRKGWLVGGVVVALMVLVKRVLEGCDICSEENVLEKWSGDESVLEEIVEKDESADAMAMD